MVKKSSLLLVTGLLAGSLNAQNKTGSLKAETRLSQKDSLLRSFTHVLPETAKDTGFTSDSTGLDYKWILHGTDTQTAHVGDYGEMNVVFKIGDTVMINTLEMNNQRPVSQQLQKPAMKGDLMSGLLRMKAGDSAVFRMLMDTLAVRAQQPKPNWVKPGDYATWAVKMVSVKTKQQMEDAIREKAIKQAAIDDKILQDYFAQHQIKNLTKTASGIYYTVLKKGAGPSPKEGQKVRVNYTGKRLDGFVFDSNVDSSFRHAEPLSFVLGKRHVIRGWDEAVALMKKGMKATFYIPSTLAYGERGPDDKIPPDSILIFDIELLSFK